MGQILICDRCRTMIPHDNRYAHIMVSLKKDSGKAEPDETVIRNGGFDLCVACARLVGAVLRPGQESEQDSNA